MPKNNKIMVITISLFFMLSMTASMMLIPNAHAATPYNIPIFAYINASPNPTGVGEQTEIIMWVQVTFGGNSELTNNYRFGEGTTSDPYWTLIITAPDGTNTTETLGVVSSPTSDYDYYFTPTTTGTYTLTFDFPATTVTSTNDPTSSLINDTYTAASISETLVVQQSPIAALPQTPLPTSYWTRPIYGENSAWYILGSNWLGQGSPGYIALGGGPNLGGNGEEFGPTTNIGSLTGHIMWTMPIESGGIVGQTATTIPGNSYFEGSAYDQRYENPIIVDGFLIFREPISTTEPMSGLTVCLNLQTGKQIWSSSTIPFGTSSFAYVYDAEDPNQHGVWEPMLITPASITGEGTVWEYYDVFTGDALFNLTEVPGGTAMLGSEGEFLKVNLVNYGTAAAPNWYMYEWNSSRIWDNDYSGASTTPVIPPPITNAEATTLINGVNQYEADDFNISLPWLNTLSLNGAPISSLTISAAVEDGVVLARAGNLPSTGENSFFGAISDTPYEYFGIGLNTTGLTEPTIGGATTTTGSVNLGTELWSNTLSPPPDNITVLWSGIDPLTNVWTLTYRETQQFIGFSLVTGKQIWGPTAPQASLDYYGSDASGSISDALAYGNIYSSAYAGILYCYNDTTGALEWTYGNGGEGNSTNSGVETPFGYYPTFINAIGNGVVYTVTTEHTPETPLFKGALARAINATTGAEIWTLSDYTGEFEYGSYSMADGYNTWFNGYDGQVYVVGRGPSQTTVAAGPQVTTYGDNVVISGTVMDTSAGTQQTEQKADFPNGVPCASDASMAQWMGYVYQQQPEPTNFTGVPVTITVTDSNHNTYVIGTATTDSSGMYTLTWTPGITGNYTVTASFAGTNGYWGSSDQTSFNVMSAPPTTAPTATPLTGLASNVTVEYGIVAIIIVIIVIGAVLAMLVTRKHA